MKITTRLSFQFTFIVLGLLLFFSVLVYYFFYTSQITKFRGNLLEKAQNSAILLINVEEVDSVLLKKIHQTTISLKEEEIAIINQKEEIIYQNNLQVLFYFYKDHWRDELLPHTLQQYLLVFSNKTYQFSYLILYE